MRRLPRSLVLTFGLFTGACFVGCGEQFSSADSSAAGVPSLAGAPSDAGSNGAGESSSAGAKNASGGAGSPDMAEGGSDAVAGAAGAGGDPGVTAPYRDEVLAAHPLVYWRMGRINAGTVPDETGGSNALVLQGTGHMLGVAGAVLGADTAIGFDGSASFAIASDARALDFAAAAAFSLECWASRETGGASYFQHLISNVNGVANDRDGYVLYLLPEPATGESARSVFERDRPGHDLGIFGSIGKPSVWAYYVAVFDGATAALYVNGTLANTSPAVGNLSPRKTPLTVARAAGGANFFKGALDEIAIYGAALSPAVIAKHFALAR